MSNTRKREILVLTFLFVAMGLILALTANWNRIEKPRRPVVPKAVSDVPKKGTISVPPPVRVIATVASCHHDVVCGGIHSVAQFQQILKTDPVLKKLYASVGSVKITTLTRATFAYDSYRIGNKIYWTKKPRLIPAGTAILSDGRFAILMNCGNLISLVPETPVADATDPTDLYPPANPILTSIPPEVGYVPPVGLYPPLNTPLPPPSPNPPSFEPTCLSCASLVPCCSVYIPPTPPVSTPEPNTVALIFCGILALLGTLIFYRR